ncbi:FGGY family carbohydrate kinase [Microbacterium lushaniae]|uniref:Carbohydrate kinase n=1 Tax=Microbacterium lushaniae TaxID=2614639 RepID=A0A5J6L095_9MICO|nr:FGGY family carbohydrate kinase [Microbacterium lushaniae]QEW01891.1 carbohydrate kinase [Microbacterium lushaniae]
MTLAVGLDVGSSTVKASLVELTDAVSVLHVARAATAATVDELLSTVAAVTRECAESARGPVAAVGIASMAESGAPLDARGRPLTPLLRWDRSMQSRHLQSMRAKHPDLAAVTGVPATGKPAVVALTALRADSPDVFTATRYWGGVADLVAHALTDVRATDHTLAARTMMAGANGEAWDAAVLSALGISEQELPEIRAPGAPVATTSAHARRFGLGRGIPVYVAGHDHVVGAWGAGVRAPGAVADSLGTAEAIVRVATDASTSRAVACGFAVGRTVDGAGTTILGGSPACGAMLAWWEAQHPGDDTLAALGGLGPDAWQTTRLTVLPYPSGRQCPRPDPDARVRVLGVAADATDRARAVLQSLVSHARWMRETADDLAGSPAADVTVLGSLAARVPAWAPLVAAAGVPTHLCMLEEPVAAAAALLAAVRAGAASGALTLPRRPVAAAGAPGMRDAYRRFLTAVADEGES